MNDLASILNWPGGIVYALVLAAVGIGLVALTRDHRDTRRFQTGLFLAAFGLRLAVAVVIYAGGLVDVLKDEDSKGWYNAVKLINKWAAEGIGPDVLGRLVQSFSSTANEGYAHVLAPIFWVTGVYGRLPAAALNAFFAALAIVLIYRLTRQLATERAARLTGALIVVMPLMVIWTSQTLKEPLVLLIEAAGLYACLRIHQGSLAARHLLIALAALLMVITVRFYVGFALGATLAAAAGWSAWRARGAGLGALAVRASVTLIVVVVLAALTQSVRGREFGLQYIQTFRAGVSPGGTSLGLENDAKQPPTGPPPPSAPRPTPAATPAPKPAPPAVAIPPAATKPKPVPVPAVQTPQPAPPPPAPTAPPVAAPIPPSGNSFATPPEAALFDIRKPSQMPAVLLTGAAYALLAPFPWQFGGVSMRFLLTAPDMVFWWILFFVVVLPGVWRTVRSRPAEVLPLLIFLVLLGGIYSAMFGNVGIAYRQRAQLFPILIALAAAGHAPRTSTRLARTWLRSIGLVVAALLPGPLKRMAYRHGFGFQVDRRARIGLAYLDCAELAIGPEARIRHGVAFLRCGSVEIGERAIIGSLNLFRGGRRIEIGPWATVLRLNVFNAIPDHDCTTNPDSSLAIGEASVVTAEHRIDFTDRVTIGRGSILAGRGSSLWTHNRRDSAPIRIGDHCYVGSEVRLAPGAIVPDCSIVGLGSVVVSELQGTYSMFAGVPAKRRRALELADYDTIFGKTRRDLPDDWCQPPPPAGETSNGRH